MNCSKCGKENPDDACFCNSCGSVLNSTPTDAPAITVKTSGMAIAALVLGILGFCTFGITAIPALIFGIISLVIIEKSGGRITGRGFAIAGIVTPVFGLLSLIVLSFAGEINSGVKDNYEIETVFSPSLTVIPDL